MFKYGLYIGFINHQSYAKKELGVATLPLEIVCPSGTIYTSYGCMSATYVHPTTYCPLPFKFNNKGDVCVYKEEIGAVHICSEEFELNKLKHCVLQIEEDPIPTCDPVKAYKGFVGEFIDGYCIIFNDPKVKEDHYKIPDYICPPGYEFMEEDPKKRAKTGDNMCYREITEPPEYFCTKDGFVLSNDLKCLSFEYSDLQCPYTKKGKLQMIDAFTCGSEALMQPTVVCPENSKRMMRTAFTLDEQLSRSLETLVDDVIYDLQEFSPEAQGMVRELLNVVCITKLTALAQPNCDKGLAMIDGKCIGKRLIPPLNIKMEKKNSGYYIPSKVNGLMDSNYDLDLNLYNDQFNERFSDHFIFEESGSYDVNIINRENDSFSPLSSISSLRKNSLNLRRLQPEKQILNDFIDENTFLLDKKEVPPIFNVDPPPCPLNFSLDPLSGLCAMYIEEMPTEFICPEDWTLTGVSCMKEVLVDPLISCNSNAFKDKQDESWVLRDAVLRTYPDGGKSRAKLNEFASFSPQIRSEFDVYGNEYSDNSSKNNEDDIFLAAAECVQELVESPKCPKGYESMARLLQPNYVGRMTGMDTPPTVFSYLSYGFNYGVRYAGSRSDGYRACVKIKKKHAEVQCPIGFNYDKKRNICFALAAVPPNPVCRKSNYILSMQGDVCIKPGYIKEKDPYIYDATWTCPVKGFKLDEERMVCVAKAKEKSLKECPDEDEIEFSNLFINDSTDFYGSKGKASDPFIKNSASQPLWAAYEEDNDWSSGTSKIGTKLTKAWDLVNDEFKRYEPVYNPRTGKLKSCVFSEVTVPQLQCDLKNGYIMRTFDLANPLMLKHAQHLKLIPGDQICALETFATPREICPEGTYRSENVCYVLDGPGIGKGK